MPSFQHEARETRDLQRHFARVVHLLSRRDVSALAREQQQARGRNIAELARYALRGRFPRNRDFPTRLTPYFVDAEGTRCAVAHLMEASGGADVVARVARRRNHAYVRELVDDRAIVAWLEREGLSTEEAALIQPGYCGVFAQDCFCVPGDDGALELDIEMVSGGTFDARVTAVYGTSARQVGDLVSGRSLYFIPEVGNHLVATDDLSTVYRVGPGDIVDTSSCPAWQYGQPPATAPLDAVIDNLLGSCGAGLGPEWTTQMCENIATSSSASTTGSASGPVTSATTTSGGGQGGEGGAPNNANASGGGCQTTAVGRPFGGALFVPSLLIAAALGLRMRRQRG